MNNNLSSARRNNQPDDIAIIIEYILGVYGHRISSDVVFEIAKTIRDWFIRSEHCNNVSKWLMEGENETI